VKLDLRTYFSETDEHLVRMDVNYSEYPPIIEISIREKSFFNNPSQGAYPSRKTGFTSLSLFKELPGLDKNKGDEEHERNC
jgi:hypothetical protein